MIRKTSGEFIDKVTQEMQTLLEERNQTAEVHVEGTLTFYVAECMEFPVMGNSMMDYPWMKPSKSMNLSHRIV